ncbi:hypothetical protein ACL02O_33210 [Micromonospora sp. MS34]|uniref:hypothetical protein n=1 Tax=Micromonospora sp. MS34 TaxID=3385971 RepID=UPI0039A0B2A5
MLWTAVLLALLVAAISIHLLVVSQQETTEENIRGPAVVKGCDVRGSEVVVTAEVFNDKEHPVTHLMVYWAEDASGVRLTKLGEPLVSIPLQPGQRATVSGTAELSEAVDEAKVAGCQVSVR